MIGKRILGLLLGALSVAPLSLSAADYKKATDGKEVVMSKLYPKNERFELSLPEVGMIMNQSYVNTMLFGGSATYYITENLGFGLSASIGSNSDKAERTCIENFYYDPNNQIGSACGGPELIEGVGDQNAFVRYGPAYVPIREMKQILIANVVWAPVYGKQLFMKSTTSYFDLFVEAGLGFATSDFYGKREVLANGNVPRGVYIDPDSATDDAGREQANTNNDKIGARVEDTDSYGINGRMQAEQQSNVLINLGIGQKFHFGKMFHIKVYMRNMTLLGTDQGFDNLLALYGGAGIRF